MLLAVDPSVRSPGAALFYTVDGSVRLIAAGRVRVTDTACESDGQRWLGVAADIFAWAIHHGACQLEPVFTYVYEKPQIYTWAKAKGDPNDLIGLAGVGSALAGYLKHQYTGVRVLTPTPAEWIGQCSKVCPTCKGKAKKKCSTCLGSAWGTPRGRRIASRLTPAERALAPDQNDAIDAIGLGLYGSGRLEVVHAYSNGR